MNLGVWIYKYKWIYLHGIVHKIVVDIIQDAILCDVTFCLFCCVGGLKKTRAEAEFDPWGQNGQAQIIKIY